MHQVSCFVNFEGIVRFYRALRERLTASITALKHKLCTPLHIFVTALLSASLPTQTTRIPVWWSAAFFPSNSICLCLHLPYWLSHSTTKKSLDKYICTFCSVVCLSSSPYAKAQGVSANQNITAQLINWESSFWKEDNVRN